MTIKEIKNDLKEIRYYYALVESLKLGSKLIPPQHITEKIERYNDIIKNAPVQFYALYVGLYVSNNTQSELAEKWKVGKDFIKKLNAKLCNYLENEFKKQENKEE